MIFDPASTRITRRGWTFELGHAEYTIYPNPKFIIKRVRRIRNLMQSMSFSLPIHIQAAEWKLIFVNGSPAKTVSGLAQIPA